MSCLLGGGGGQGLGIGTSLTPLLSYLQEVGSIIGKVGAQFCSVCPLQPEASVQETWHQPLRLRAFLYFCLLQKGETVKRIREQVRLGCGEEPRAPGLEGRGDSCPTFSLDPTVWDD